MSDSDELDRLVEAVLKRAKYRNLCADLVRNVAGRELAARHNWREALKATKSKLHQVAAAYLDRRMDYESWLHRLESATKCGDGETLRALCREVMGTQSSTRERLGILDSFYQVTLHGLTPIRSVLDIACGLNPLAIPWMPLASDVEYFAYDVYADMIGFVGAFLRAVGVRGQAIAIDVTQSAPKQRADVALILKSLPCLEQLDRSVGRMLIESVQAQHLLVSFPIRSLGGREKGMAKNYEQRFRQLVEGESWSVQRFEFTNELAFVVSK